MGHVREPDLDFIERALVHEADWECARATAPRRRPCVLFIGASAWAFRASH